MSSEKPEQIIRVVNGVRIEMDAGLPDVLAEIRGKLAQVAAITISNSALQAAVERVSDSALQVAMGRVSAIAESIVVQGGTATETETALGGTVVVGPPPADAPNPGSVLIPIGFGAGLYAAVLQILEPYIDDPRAAQAIALLFTAAIVMAGLAVDDGRRDSK